MALQATKRPDGCCPSVAQPANGRLAVISCAQCGHQQSVGERMEVEAPIEAIGDRAAQPRRGCASLGAALLKRRLAMKIQWVRAGVVGA